MGVVTHHYWLKRQNGKAKPGVPKKPAKPVQQDAEPGLYAHLDNEGTSSDQPTQYDHIKGSKVKKGAIPTFENTAYGSRPILPPRPPRDSERGTSASGRDSDRDTGENPYVHNQSHITTRSNMSYRATTPQKGNKQAVYATIPEQDESGNSQATGKTSQTGSTQQQDEITVGGNIAYKATNPSARSSELYDYTADTPSPTEDSEAAHNTHTARGGQRSQGGVAERVRQLDIPLQANVAYLKQSADKDDAPKLNSADSARGVAPKKRGVSKNGDIPLKNNIAYKQHILT